jgi:hypothetical protein
LLIGSGVSLAGLALGVAGVHAQAASPGSVAASGSTAGTATAATQGELDTFHALSRLLTGHEGLDLTVGARLYQAMTAHDPAFAGAVTQLSAFAQQHGHRTVEPLEQALKGQPLHATLMSIIGAWYSGVIEPGTGATVYAYERALMYQMSRDGMVIPTYAYNGPNYWVAEPPPLDRLPTF